jgi:hypothetical protein
MLRERRLPQKYEWQAPRDDRRGVYGEKEYAMMKANYLNESES